MTIKSKIKIASVDGEARRKVEYMYKHLSDSTPKEKALDTMIEILGLDPYDSRYYKYMVKMFCDNNNEIEKLAKYFGYEEDVVDYKGGFVNTRYQSLDKSTLDEAKAAEKELESFCKTIAVGTSSEMKNLQKIILGLKHDQAMEIFESLQKETEDEALHVKAQIQEYCKQEEIDEDISAIQKIDKIL